jgi:hypothetical protein
MALLIATDTYTDPTFLQLAAPQADADALGAVLRDPRIGHYQVKILHNAAAHEVNREVEALFADAGPDDVILLYFSGHGVKDDAGRLHFITPNSDSRLLASTAVPAVFVRDQMDRTVSRQVIVLLDCCYAGAFPPGARHRAGDRVEFPQLTSRGRAVITSSSELEYSYETSGDTAGTILGKSTKSVFTSALVRGLRTGDADLDSDGLIEVNELYEYVYQQVRASTPQQSPQRKFELEGTLYLAGSSRRRPPFHGLPDGIAHALRGPHQPIRHAAVSALLEIVHSGDASQSRPACAALHRLTRDNDATVRQLALDAIRALRTPVSPRAPSHRDRPPQARRLPIGLAQEIAEEPMPEPVQSDALATQLAAVPMPPARRTVLAWVRGRRGREPERT